MISIRQNLSHTAAFRITHAVCLPFARTRSISKNTVSTNLRLGSFKTSEEVNRESDIPCTPKFIIETGRRIHLPKSASDLIHVLVPKVDLFLCCFVECTAVARRGVLPCSIPGEDRRNALHYPSHIRTRKGIADDFTHSLHSSPGHQQRLIGISIEGIDDTIMACETRKGSLQSDVCKFENPLH